MGCQASKPATAPKEVAGSQSPTRKTLLEASEAAKKNYADAQTPVASVAGMAPAPFTPEDSKVQMPPAFINGDAPAKPTAAELAGSPLSLGVDGFASGSRAPSDGTQSHGALSHAAHSQGTHSHGFLKKSRTLCTESNELDIMVVEFTSHDSTVGSLIGRNCKEMRWKVMHDRGADPIDIKLHVQEHKLHHNDVSIESNGQEIFCGAGPHAKTKMIEDFHYQWPFRATMRGINEENFFEFHPPHACSDAWFPATITCQRDDGCFEVRAQEPDANGRLMQMTYPAVHKESLREAASQKAISVPEKCLMLDVPKQDPLHAALRMGNGDLVTHHFGRPSPASKSAQQPAQIALMVSKDRNTVSADVGHSVLSHFVSGEVRSKQCEAERLQHSWTIQAGPFAEHTIQVLKKHTLGTIVTLLVDGEVLVEASAADIGCHDKEWQCHFRFVGERVLDFEVYKTNNEGSVLDETAHVKERRKYVHECCVTIPNDWDFTSAQLFVDGTPFVELPMVPQEHEEQNLTMTPMAMLHSYGIATPYKVDKHAPSNISALANQILVKAVDGKKVAGGFWARCCNVASVVKDDCLFK
jgi:hypothetical protein